jgi:hypothetical protein
MEEEGPGTPHNWGRIYLLVVVVLTLVITGLYFFTEYFKR